jgi:hypothetical protein
LLDGKFAVKQMGAPPPFFSDTKRARTPPIYFVWSSDSFGGALGSVGASSFGSGAGVVFFTLPGV